MSISRTEISEKLKKMIVSRLNLEQGPESIDDDEPLFGEGLGLDSIDSLEIVIGIEKEFNLTLTEDEMEEPEKIFYSISTLTDFIEQKLEKQDT